MDNPEEKKYDAGAWSVALLISSLVTVVNKAGKAGAFHQSIHVPEGKKNGDY